MKIIIFGIIFISCVGFFPALASNDFQDLDNLPAHLKSDPLFKRLRFYFQLDVNFYRKYGQKANLETTFSQWLINQEQKVQIAKETKGPGEVVAASKELAQVREFISKVRGSLKAGPPSSQSPINKLLEEQARDEKKRRIEILEEAKILNIEAERLLGENKLSEAATATREAQFRLKKVVEVEIFKDNLISYEATAILERNNKLMEVLISRGVKEGGFAIQTKKMAEYFAKSPRAPIPPEVAKTISDYVRASTRRSGGETENSVSARRALEERMLADLYRKGELNPSNLLISKKDRARINAERAEKIRAIEEGRRGGGGPLESLIRMMEEGKERGK